MNDDLYYLNRFTGTDIVIDESDTGVVEKLNFTCASTQVSKNLLDDTAFSTQTVSGVTFTKNSDGTILANGTATAGISLTLSNFVYFTLPAGSYIISDGVSGTAITYFTYIDPIDIATYNAGTFTLANATSIRARIVVRTGITLNNVLFKPQIEIGSTATSYVSYNPTPDYPVTIYSSGDSGKISMWSHKKNMFDKANNIITGKNLQSNGNSGNFISCFTTTFLNINENTSYAFSGLPDSTDGFLGSRIGYICFYDLNNIFISAIGVTNVKTKTFTTPVNAKYLKYGTNSNFGTASAMNAYLDNATIQLELAGVTPYEPYTGSVVPITLPVKNLFNTREVSGSASTYTIINDNSFKLGNSAVAWKYVTFKISGLKKNTDYTISANITKQIEDAGGIYFIACVLPNSEVGKIKESYGIESGITFNSVNYDVLYLKFAHNIAIPSNEYTLSYIQFEEGTTKTTYEPYVGYIGGSLPNGVADTDVQKKIQKKILAPTDIYDYGVNATSGIPYVRITKGSTLSMPTTTAYNGSMLMTSYKEKTSSNFNVTPSGYFNTYYDRYYVSIFNTAFTDLATAKTLLTGEIIYTELATPVDITITKPQIPTYEGINTITTTNNIKPTMSIEAWKR